MKTIDRIAEAFESVGMKITDRKFVNDSFQLVAAKINLSTGTLTVTCGSNGTAIFEKPNGKRKMAYEKSYAQLRQIAKQIIDANK